MRGTFLLVACLLVSGTARAAAPPALHLDEEGMALPEGAVGRLGSTRLLHGEALMDLAVSPDGRLVASIGNTHLGQIDVRIWDAVTGKEVARVEDPQLWFHLVRFTSGGDLFCFGANGDYLIRDGRTGRVRKSAATFMALAGQHVLDVSPDGKKLAVGAQDRVHVLDAATANELAQLSVDGAMESAIESLTFSPDGLRVAVLRAGKIHLLDVRAGKAVWSSPAQGGKMDPQFALVFAAGGKYLVALREGTLTLLDAATGAKVAGFTSPASTLTAIGPAATPTAVACVTNEGSLIEVALPGGKTKTLTREPLSGFEPGVRVTPKRTALRREGNIILLDTATGRVSHPELLRRRPLKAVRFLPGDEVVTWDENERLSFWDVRPRKLSRTREVLQGVAGVLEGQVFDLTSDGKLLARFKTDEIKLVVEQAGGGKPLWEKVLALDNVMPTAAFSPCGRYLALLQEKHQVVFASRTGKELFSMATAASEGTEARAAWSPDSRLLAVADVGKGEIGVRERASGEIRHRIKSPGLDLVAFRGDGRALAVGTQTGEVKIIPLFGAGRRLELVAGTSPLGGIAFSRNGRMLAAACGNVVRVWDETGRPVFSFRGHEGVITGLAFSPDGRQLVSASRDGTALVWDVTAPVQAPRAESSPDVLWSELANPDAAAAQKAVSALVRRGDESVTFLASKLTPLRAAEPKRISRLIADLDGDTVAQRQQAQRALQALDLQAEGELRKALETVRSAEQRRALRRLIAQLDGPCRDPERLRELRAAEVLEHVGTPAARALLRRLAKGADGRLTREARETLERMPR